MVYDALTMDLTPKQQTSEAVRQAENILIMTGQRPSVDQAVSVLALTMILRKFGKQATAVISDQLPAAVVPLAGNLIEKNLGGVRDFILKLDTAKAEVDKLRYEMVDGKLNVVITPYKGNFAPSDVTFGYGETAAGGYDLLFVIGVPGRARIDKVYDQNTQVLGQVPVINFDFHRSNEGYGAVNMIDGNASSLSEMLVALSESLQSGLIDAEIATPLLMGIVSATDRFTAAHTTSKSLTVAAQMMAAGASQPQVVRALYRGGDGAREGGREGGRNQGQGSRDNANRDRNERQNRPERTERVERPDRNERVEQPRREPQAVRPAEPDNDSDLIIAPAHIEMIEEPAAPELAQPVVQPAGQPTASQFSEPRVQMPPAQNDFQAAAEPVSLAPGQLPLEMSPLGSQVVGAQRPTQQSVAPAPMPSSFQNDRPAV